ncbi:MAG: Stealth CR1 domain-containing protein [Ilumatobacter sp.]|uniref:stealth family protein n=1 Tax=Ilumatobacter sp. TaxID=1967498 RepID=UPI003C787AEB
MRSKLRRLRTLVRRYRIDRRLPPPVLELYKRTTALRTADRAERATAERRRILGESSAGRDGAVARLGSRRLQTAGDLHVSTADLGHEVATAVSAALVSAGVAHFVTDRRGDGLAFGVELPDRAVALKTLSAAFGAGWFLEWADGSRSGTVALSDAADDRRVRRARSWILFRAHRWGDSVVGPGSGTKLTFWDQGASGLLERVGTRSQERFDARCPVTTELIDGRSYPGRTAFPVGANFEHVADPIDIVYTWVDGSDPAWLDAFRATASAEGRLLDEVALDPARYRSREELRYSLRSVWAYCGWVRKIWIVTAGQRPDWLADHPRIQLVDHADILPADALPTFNSHAIEAALHRIDGLAEQFVYFNDDMLVARPIRPELFFTPNGLARCFQSGARPPGVEDDRTLAVDTGAIRGRELLRERFGRVVTGKPYHSPYPLRRRACLDAETEFADVIDRTQHSRFRSPNDLSTAASFFQHFALATGCSVLGDVANEYVHVESGRLDWHLDRIRLSEDLDTFCINETSDAHGIDDDREARIREFFASTYPLAAPWEATRS